MSEDKNIPKPKRHYSSYIYLDFHCPTPAQFETLPKSHFVRKRLAKHPNSHLIHVSFDDFEVRGDEVRLKADPNIQEKYACLSKADHNAKITIAGHGMVESSLIASEEGAYDSSGDSDRKGKAAPFTTAHVSSILLLIKDPQVKKLDHTQCLQENLLKISVLACHGEYFARELMQTLMNSSFACQITSTAKNHILYMDENGKRYRTIEHKQREEQILSYALLLTILAIVFLLSITFVAFINPSYKIEIGLGAPALVLLVFAAATAIASYFHQGYDQNSQAKTVLFPAIEDGRTVIKAQNKALLANTSRFAFESSAGISAISTTTENIDQPYLNVSY